MHSASNARKRKNSSVERDSSLASSAGSSVHNHTPLQERPGSSEPHQNELHNIQEPRRPRKVEMMSQRRINQIRSAQKSYRERQALHLKELEAKVRLYETALKESDNLDTLSWIQRLASLEAENECLKKAQLVNSQQAKSAGTCNSCLMERDKYVQANMRISELEVRLRIAESAVRQNGYHGDEDDNDAAVEFRDVANSEVPQRPHLAPCYSEIGTNDCHGRQNALNRAANDPAELLPRFADRTASLDQPVTRPDSLIFSILSSIKNVHLAEPGGKSEGISSFLHNPIFMEWVQSIPVPPLSSSSLLAYKFSEGCAGARYGSVDFEWARQQLSEIPSLHGAQFIISDFINLLYVSTG
ncbi:hypothetical protein HDU83_008985 [Entophlyctis luteolus]|nr:hypothetical protein HDU83_008985 [Entophlyctis luteolus]